MPKTFTVEARFTGSETWQNRADYSIAHGALTNSKRPSTFVEGVYPTHLLKGHGAYVWDTENTKYLDFICGLGSSILGYADGGVTKAVTEAALRGPTLSLSSTLEVEVAEAFKAAMPFIERLRFLKTGSDACRAAIKIARAYQGVSYESEAMSFLQGIEKYRSFFQRQDKELWQKQLVQSLRQGLSGSAICDRNKKASSSQVLENQEGRGDGEQAPSEKIQSNQETRQDQSLLCSEDGNQEGIDYKKALQGMRGLELPSASLQLFKTIRREMALSDASCGYTQKRIILSDGYHGDSDPFVSLTQPHLGVPFDASIIPLTGNEDLIPIAAAVIVEPIITEDNDNRRQWLTNLREQCTKHRALLIFDEVITGFRVPMHSVTKYYGIEPDLICLGKAIANGYPLSVVAGKQGVMECGEYFVSSTFAGEMTALAAAKETIYQLQHKRDIKLLWEMGKQFTAKFNSMWPGGVWIEGYPTRGVFKAKDELTKALFFQECVKAGILVGPSFFFNYAHMDQAVYSSALSLFRDILIRLSIGGIELKGSMPKSPFAQKQRENT